MVNTSESTEVATGLGGTMDSLYCIQLHTHRNTTCDAYIPFSTTDTSLSLLSVNDAGCTASHCRLASPPSVFRQKSIPNLLTLCSLVTVLSASNCPTLDPRIRLHQHPTAPFPPCFSSQVSPFAHLYFCQHPTAPPFPLTRIDLTKKASNCSQPPKPLDPCEAVRSESESMQSASGSARDAG